MKRRLELAVAAWMAIFLLAAGAVWFTMPAQGAPAETGYLSTWPPHQIPGPAVEFDGQFTNFTNYHTFDLTVVGYKDGVAWTDNDSVVCGGHSCGDAKTMTKAWGCHDYKTEVWGTVDGASWGPIWSGVWHGCR